MTSQLEFQTQLVEVSNANLTKAEGLKSEMLQEVLSSDLLSATLKVHMYIEQELNKLYEYIFGKSKTFKNLSFALKLKLIHEGQILPKNLFDVINTLNKIRNEFAHTLNFHKNDDIYHRLVISLSNDFKELHEIEVKMNTLLHGEMNDEEKYTILLAQSWIQVAVFCSTKEQKKFEFGNRLGSEVKSEIEKSNLDLK